MASTPPADRCCAVCGAVLDAGTPSSRCPKCLLTLGLGPEGPSGSSPSPDDSDRSPTRFGHYRLIRQIGRGGMGVVYEALDLNLHRPVALKLILDSAFASPVTRRRFAIEAAAAAKLDHPHIVPIYEVGEQEGQPYLSMKLVVGDGLRTRIARGEFRPETVAGDRSAARDRQRAIARLIATLARAIHHAHQRGVLHRDLKPGNILLDAEGHPYITDFGLAKLVAPADDPPGTTTPTVSGAILGTPDYMSPEQARGAQATAASDLFSLGAVLYELLVGRPPFHASTPMETLRLLIGHEPSPPRVIHRWIDPDLQTIGLKCLEKDPRTRYSSAAALADDLERWLRREPIHAHPAGPLLRTTRWVRRNPVGAALIMSLCLGLAFSLRLLGITRAAQEEGRIRGAIVRQQQWDIIEAELRSTNTAPIEIRSDILAVLGNHRPLQTHPGAPLRFRFAVSAAESHTQVAKAYGPFLKRLEQEMARRLNRPVLFDLLLCREVGPDYLHVARRNADFQRMGTLPYLLAQREAPGIEPVAREDSGNRGVIFVRQELYDQGLTNLSQLRGRSFAFTDTNSTLSLLAKSLLVRAGVSGTNLVRFRSFDTYDAETATLIQDIQRKTGQTDVAPVVRHNREVIRTVLRGHYDAGATKDRYFQREKRKGLAELASFEIPPDVYVVRPAIDPTLRDAFRSVLLGLEDSELLAELPLQPVRRFLPSQDTEFDPWRSVLTNHAIAFLTAATPPQPPAP